MSGLRGGIVVSLALLLQPGCGKSDSNSDSSCAEGSERCACYGNGTCDDGLTCYSNVCVGDSASGQAGAGGGDPGSGGDGATAATGNATSTNGGGSNGGAGSGGTAAGGTTSLDTSNLILNGNFSSGEDYWHCDNTSTMTVTSVSTVSGAYCVGTVSPSPYYGVGWPVDAADAAVLEPLANYTFSFRVKGGTDFVNGYASLSAKLGQAADPFASLVQESVVVTTEWTPHAYPVVGPDAVFGAVGLYFEVIGSTQATGIESGICLDDVRLAKD